MDPWAFVNPCPRSYLVACKHDPAPFLILLLLLLLLRLHRHRIPRFINKNLEPIRRVEVKRKPCMNLEASNNEMPINGKLKETPNFVVFSGCFLSWEEFRVFQIPGTSLRWDLSPFHRTCSEILFKVLHERNLRNENGSKLVEFDFRFTIPEERPHAVSHAL